jgi:glutamine synthetase type III
MTKQIRISEKVHDKLKVHVAKNKGSMVEFADWAITTAMRDYEMFKDAAKYREEFKKIMNSNNKK